MDAHPACPAPPLGGAAPPPGGAPPPPASPPPVPRQRSRLGPLWLQVLVAIVAGIAIGALFPAAGVALKPLGDAFVRLIRLALAPIIFGTVVVGIARMGDLREVGRVGAKALLYFEVVSTASLLMGLAAVDLLRPGAGMNVDPSTLDPRAIAGYAETARHLGIIDFLLNIIPASVGGVFVDGNMLQVILFGVLFGAALAGFRDAARPLVDMLDLVLRALFGIVRLVMALAPLGTLGALAFTVGRYGLASLVQLAQLTAEVWLTSALFVALVLGTIARLAGFSLWRFLGYIREEILITFGTSSSEAVLAPLMTKMEALGCAKPIVGLVMPAGYTFNADGTAIYLAMGAIFIAQATNTPLGLRDQLVVLLVLMLTSKGSAGVAGAGFVTLAATLSTMNQIPAAGLVLMLGVDRFTNAARAIVNIIGNGVATIVIARSEGAFDEARAAAVLGAPRRPAPPPR
ncbi:MAG: C4-dicarboxylate transporter DctA [Janthinobacterium lividum]